MEIQSGTVLSTISLSNIVRAANSQGKVSFPINPTAIAYTNFKNINVIPSSDSTGSYSVSRLRALDNLIEQLNRMKDRNKTETAGLNDLDLEEQKILISELSEEIHIKLQADIPYKLPIETSGLLFNILV